MYLNTPENRLAKDPEAHALYKAISKIESDARLDDAQVYFNFPLYRDDTEGILRTKLLLGTKSHGFIIFGISAATDYDADKELKLLDDELTLLHGQILSKLIKYPSLKQDRNSLLFPVETAIYSPNIQKEPHSRLESFLIRNQLDVKNLFEKLRQTASLSDSVFSETLSIIEGGKGLLRTKERSVSDEDKNTKAFYVAKIERAIRRFDRDQKAGYMTPLDGPQRIRGLAGSGKTVILAMKVAMTHLTDPDAKILYTFHTKSLYQQVKRLITRFYRQFDDVDPDWEKISILHAWGGSYQPGVYSDACKDNGVRAISFDEAKFKNSSDPFGAACEELLTSPLKEKYDYIFVDEAQDFSKYFLQLCLHIAREKRLIFGMDVFQNIFQVVPPEAKELFDEDVELVEDIVLHKCYRTPREVLVCAHAIGLGVYGKLVQMVENADHWTDLGYVFKQGEFIEGSTIIVERPEENSPTSIDGWSDSVVVAKSFENYADEIDTVVSAIVEDIKAQKLQPEDILVICADDKNCRSYFNDITEGLYSQGIATNNTQANKYSIGDFSMDGRVTLSTVHKAKGNEAYSVYVVGADAPFKNQNIRARNLLFTAMTRTKAWLFISGVGSHAKLLAREIESAISNYPNLIFTYPSPKDLAVMKRDIQRGDELEKKLKDLLVEYGAESIDEMISSLKGARKRK